MSPYTIQMEQVRIINVNEALCIDCLKHCCYFTLASIRLICTYSYTSGSPRAKKETARTSGSNPCTFRTLFGFFSLRYTTY